MNKYAKNNLLIYMVKYGTIYYSNIIFVTEIVLKGGFEMKKIWYKPNVVSLNINLTQEITPFGLLPEAGRNKCLICGKIFENGSTYEAHKVKRGEGYECPSAAIDGIYEERVQLVS